MTDPIDLAAQREQQATRMADLPECRSGKVYSFVVVSGECQRVGDPWPVAR